MVNATLVRKPATGVGFADNLPFVTNDAPQRRYNRRQLPNGMGRSESDAMQFEKHVVVVTGAAKGIGQACARAFAREGATVALVDVDKSANSLVSELAERARYFSC